MAGNRAGAPKPAERRGEKPRQPLNTSEIILIASVACLVAAAAVQAVIALVVDLSAK